ncbi:MULTISPECIES: 3-hydroxyacyl-ACP dehydratase FabZ family protein [unclassified Streptomyces]|uniref:3-hydroxyacyl-ACP dehydratase FabZ family protein n=1 Tax=unclassified Streptomyces TaxID=2593676 RepID=UPI0035DC33E0
MTVAESVAESVTGVSPVTAGIRVVRPATAEEGGRLTAATVCRVDPAEQIFAGHYPGFPIFPGVCVIECVRRSALATAPGPVTLAAVESARFRGPVLPGDELAMELVWKPDGPEGRDWRVTATARTDRGDAASIRLGFRTGGRS